MYIKYLKGMLACLVISLFGCDKFLDAKSDMSLAVPSTVKDLQAIMDYELYTIRSYPVSGDIASDYYYLNEVNINGLNAIFQNIYLLKGEETATTDWVESYKKIMYANVTLDLIDKARLDGLTEQDRDRVKGSALFVRGWNFYWLATLFSPAYVEQTASQSLGIPLRKTSDINVAYGRSTLKETFEQIVNDLVESTSLLPDLPLNSTRPSRSAAFAALARSHLYMGDLQTALRYADSCLFLKSDLIDYAQISQTSNTPFSSMNNEVILHNTLAGSGGVFTGTRALLDTALLKSYGANDFRKNLFFRMNGGPAEFNFKGNYAGPVNVYQFCGIATDEIYLIKAECAARLGMLDLAKATLGDLLVNRYISGNMPDMELAQHELVKLIIQERSKELAFRFGIRWSDIKRLNQHYNENIVVQRRFENQSFSLEANDPRFTFLIPWEVVLEGNLTQNAR